MTAGGRRGGALLFTLGSEYGASVAIRVGLLLAVLAFTPQSVVCAAGGEDVPERVQVFYPRGDCETGMIEVEVWDRDQHAWRPHPEHWRIPADSCQEEDAGVLLHEIRVRCVDSENPARASEWRVGVEVFHPRPAADC